MKIERVEVLPIRVPNRVPLKIATSLLTQQDNVIVRLHAGGLAGIGETQPLLGFAGCSESQLTIVPLIRERFVPLLVGQDVFEIERMMRAMEQAISGNPYAKAAVADALFDLQARALGVPLYQLLGGRFRDRIPVVWTIGIKDRAAMVEEARWALDRGFRLLKLKVGAQPAGDDIRMVEAIRGAVGPGIGLRVDGNTALSFTDALRLLRALAEFDLELAEQPLAIDDLDGMARLIELTGVPIMPDESLTSPRSALAIVARRAASIFGMKLAKHGGIYGGRQIAAIAQAAGLPIYPGGQPGTSVGSATAAHFYAATWNVTIGGDFHVGAAGWLADDIVHTPIRIADGHAFIPDGGPGIGVELDPLKLEKYAVRL
jgi:muconate cycloisomerase